MAAIPWPPLRYALLHRRSKSSAVLERLAATADLLLVDFQGIAVLHVQLFYVSENLAEYLYAKASRQRKDLRTVSGLSCGVTRWPSKRKRTLEMFLPWRSQKAFINLPRAVVRLILKNTSLLLSVTLILRCSLWPSSGFCCTFGEPLSDILAVYS